MLKYVTFLQFPPLFRFPPLFLSLCLLSGAHKILGGGCSPPPLNTPLYTRGEKVTFKSNKLLLPSYTFIYVYKFSLLCDQSLSLNLKDSLAAIKVLRQNYRGAEENRVCLVVARKRYFFLAWPLKKYRLLTFFYFVPNLK